jgi:hypothetical protein
MTVNAARRTRRRSAAATPTPEPLIGVSDPLATGEIHQTVFDCPTCSRPLAVGAKRCPGCGTHLLRGVPFSKATTFVAAGLAIGLLVGGAGGVALGLTRATPAVVPPAVVPVPLATALPSALPVAGASSGSGGGILQSAAPLPSALPTTGTGAGSTGTSTMPTSIQAALSQATTMNQRLEASGSALAAILTARQVDAQAIADTLRAMSADSLSAESVASRVSGWTDSAAIGTDLTTLYQGIHDLADQALDNSVRNAAAYRTAARDMLTLVAGTHAVDQRIAALAAANGVMLPGPSTAP